MKTTPSLNASGRAICSPFPPVLDVCASGRSFWFDHADGRALFCDIRRGHYETKRRSRTPDIVKVDPDIQCDFRQLPFRDESFWLIVYDPPHVIRNEALGAITRRYGVLNGDWRSMIKDGFSECWRVLKPNGTLIFKWCEVQIPLNEIFPLMPCKPLFGNRCGKKAMTHWMTFFKANND
jgi:SAM-dependent methyltransferase